MDKSWNVSNLIAFQITSERIAELKVQEYMRQKLEREKRLALERRLAKEEKDKEYSRIIQRQEKLMESKTERNELEYRRQREEVEREFRRREREAAIKKREIADGIAKARTVQLEEVVSKFVTNRTSCFMRIEFVPFLPIYQSDSIQLLMKFFSRNVYVQCKSLVTKPTSRSSWTS